MKQKILSVSPCLPTPKIHTPNNYNSYFIDIINVISDNLQPSCHHYIHYVKNLNVNGTTEKFKLKGFTEEEVN